MAPEAQTVHIDEKGRSMSATSLGKEEAGQVDEFVDLVAEQAYGQYYEPRQDSVTAFDKS